MSASTIARKAARVVLPIAAAGGLLAASTGAQAQTLSQDTNYYYGAASAGDCTVTSALSKATQFGWQVTGWGITSCNYTHSYITISTALKATNGVSSWTVYATQPSTVSGRSSTGWFRTVSFSCNPNLLYQAVTTTTVSGIGTFYSTTGSPKRVC